ncbi:MAG: VanZ family protein [Gammaproteobacteria bacterium]|nr:VanZ family protein [Gammaproteobacteria bacterium]
MRWRLLWVLSLLFIPVLSFYGRNLQALLHSLLQRQYADLLVSLMLLVMTGLFLAWLSSKRRIHWQSALVVILVFFIGPLFLERFEERIHFILFGLLGFSSRQLFRYFPALLLTYAVSGLDELWQWWLPDRVGDWRDVFMNMFAGFVAVWIAERGRR